MQKATKWKSKYYLQVIVFLLICFSNNSLFSQTSGTDGWVNSDHKRENLMGLKQGWFVGADFGTNLYYGAVTLYNNFPKPKDFCHSFGRGYSFYGGKKFKYGLAAEAQVFKGTIQGEKISPPLYERKFTGDLLNYSVSVKYNLSQLFFREKQDRKFFNRLGLYATVGFGQVFYRSILYKLAYNNQWYIENVTGYKATGIDLAGPNSAGGVITSKASRASSFILPVGGKVNFKLNKRTDIVLDIYYVNVFSTAMDSWVRTWTKDDRYLYTGLGLCYNFGRGDEDEVPSEQRMLRPKERKAKAESAADIDTGLPTESSSKMNGPTKKSTRKSKKEDKDLEVKMKLYELQLKLFEMQFLLTQ
jgi:hypothetical protein